MNQKELKNLKVGNIVVITTHGGNQGKRGMVTEILRDMWGESNVYLQPLDGEFTFYNPKTRRKNKHGFYAFAHQTFQLIPSIDEPIKEFYMTPMLGNKPITWPANNYTPKELVTLKRFIKDLNEKASGIQFNGISILDEDDIF